MKEDYRYKKSHYGGRKYEKLIGNYFPSLGILKITHYVWINNAYKGVATSLNSCENFSTRVSFVTLSSVVNICTISFAFRLLAKNVITCRVKLIMIDVEYRVHSK